jgi:phage gp46-like protein
MSDIALVWNAALGGADFALEKNDLAVDDGLETSVYLSLFLDARAEDSDELPAGVTDRRGWWGDAFPVVDGDRIGSRLWLLARAKSTPETLRKAEGFAREALGWMLVDRVAARIDVAAEAVNGDVMLLRIAIHRPTGDAVEYRYNYTWASQAARRVS